MLDCAIIMSLNEPDQSTADRSCQSVFVSRQFHKSYLDLSKLCPFRLVRRQGADVADLGRRHLVSTRKGPSRYE